MSDFDYPWREAIFSDGTELFRTPSEPEANSTVTVRLRMPNAEGFRAFVFFEGRRIPMRLYRTHILFSLYEAELSVWERQVRYCFLVETPEGSFFYNRYGLNELHDRECDFRITPGFRTPDWAKGAVMYQIFVDRFCNGNVENSVTDREYFYIDNYVSAVPDWNRYPDANDVGMFYGGDLKGILKKLDYLQ
ncbi:MAG: alpha amylase N-terminal ig-like domain-containing protein, partial [Lachnospiraceae bacterium]|nr:alpha amylase N-terminal ig-like domain-containing protein [Lachnospiraceae bacterium]